MRLFVMRKTESKHDVGRVGTPRYPQVEDIVEAWETDGLYLLAGKPVDDQNL